MHSSARVLVVDDEPLLRKALRRVLNAHDVVEVDGGRAAMEVLREDGNFDAIISDLMMPEMDGAKLYEAVFQLDQALAKRMVFLTGGAVTRQTQGFLELHSPPLLEKPVSRVELLDVIELLRR